MKTMTRKRIIFFIALCTMLFACTVPAHAAASKPKKPKLASVKRIGVNTVQIRWKRSENAEKYEVFFAQDSGQFRLLKKTDKLSFLHEKAALGHTYRYKVRAVNHNKKSSFSSVKQVTIPAAVPDFKSLYNSVVNAEDRKRVRAADSIIGKKVYLEVSSVDIGSIYLDSILFECENPTGDYYISMKINYTDFQAGTARIYYSDEKQKATCYGTIDCRQDLMTAEHSLTLSPSSSLSGISRSELLAKANAEIRIVLQKWSALLGRRFGFSLREIGFHM